MGVTAIRVVENRTGFTARIRNMETPSDTDGGKGFVTAGQNKDLYMWIPWCDKAGDFPKHRISVDLVDNAGNTVTGFDIWQANRGGSDLVRASTDDAWADPGNPIGGRSTVDGDRILTIQNSSVSLRTFVPPRIEPPSQGTGWVSFSRPNQSTFTFTGESSGPYPYKDATIVRVTNTARNVNNDVAVPLELELVDADGRAAGPQLIQPGATVGPPFEGLRFAGKWKARAQGSNTLLRDHFTIEVTWKGDPSAERAEVVISAIFKDPPRSDVQPETGEYVELTNVGAQRAEVGDWYLEDNKTRIVVPSGYSIEPNATLRVYTGPGTNTQDKYYAGRGRAVWNNTGDSARLYTNNGILVADFTY